MGNPVRLTLQLAASVANGICLSQTPAAAGALTLNGTLVTGGVATMDVARRVYVASTGADSSVIFTITGTNRDNNPQTITVTGVATPTPVASSLDFLTVTSVTASAATVGAITVGTGAIGSTAWVSTAPEYISWALSAAVQILSGSVTYTVEHTYDDVNKAISPSIGGFVVGWNSASPPVAWSHPVLVGLIANGEGTYANQPIMAHRLTITAGNGLAAFWSVQGGQRS